MSAEKEDKELIKRRRNLYEWCDIHQFWLMDKYFKEFEDYIKKEVREETIKEVIKIIDDRLRVLPKASIGEDYTQATYELSRLKELLEASK